ncbi:MAG: ThuA domain-containing protein [Verrucomicrobiae bacterium]|nr:ThuA domain-containing protein [Verrucomicrobiae bacterium]
MKNPLPFTLAAILGLGFGLVSPKLAAEEKLSVLLIDGQNNHAWQETTPVLTAILQQSGRFDVTVSTSPPAAPKPPRQPNDKDPAKVEAWKKSYQKWESEVAAFEKETAAKWDAWRPDFSAYDVVMSNYNGEIWPEPVQKALEDYVSGGGGFVAVHAANNSHPEWKGYNEMIAVGGWGGRSELSGPYLRLRDGDWTRDMTPGRGGSHGEKHEFLVETRAPEHPIMKGLPTKWRHAQDELYDRLRGPAKNVTVLASAFSDESTRGSGEDEPMLMVIDYGKGRVFHTTLGHDVTAMSDVGFQETLKRGTEWAATGKVTFPAISAEEMPAETVGVREVTTAAN